MTYESLFVNPNGRTSRGQYLGALIPLLAALALYYLLVRGPSGRLAMLVMLFPAMVLHARRLHDMGRPVWLLLAPAALLIATFWLRAASPDTPIALAVTLATIAVSAIFVLWGLAGRSRPG